MKTPLALALMLAVGACSAQSPAETTRSFPSQNGPVQVQTVAGGLEHPWGLAFLPDGRMLVTERPGRLRLLPGQLLPLCAHLIRACLRRCRRRAGPAAAATAAGTPAAPALALRVLLQHGDLHR